MNSNSNKEIVPVLTRIIVQKVEEKITNSRLILPKEAKEDYLKNKARLGVVLSVGGEVKEVKKGDEVIYNSAMSKEIKVDNKEVVVMDHTNVLCILRG